MRQSMELLPGAGLGPFRLGATLLELGSVLRDEATYGVVHIGGDVIANPRTADVVLRCDAWGTELFVDAATQRLKFIRHTCTADVGVVYQGRTLMGSSITPTFAFVNDVLGPTIPYDVEDGDFVLRYPGLAVRFDLRGASAEEAHSQPPPIKHADGAPVTMTRLELAVDAPLDTPPLGLATVEVGKGVRWDGGVGITFASTAQDVVAGLGAPERIVTRHTDPASIHRRGQTMSPRYVLTYPNVGIDVVVSDTTHTVTKIVLYNAHPTSAAFLSYLRCDFCCALPPPFPRGTVLQNGTPWSEVADGVSLPTPLLYTPRFIADAVTIVGSEGLILMVTRRGYIAGLTVFDNDAAEAVVALGPPTPRPLVGVPPSQRVVSVESFADVAAPPGQETSEGDGDDDAQRCGGGDAEESDDMRGTPDFEAVSDVDVSKHAPSDRNAEDTSASRSEALPDARVQDAADPPSGVWRMFSYPDEDAPAKTTPQRHSGESPRPRGKRRKR